MLACGPELRALCGIAALCASGAGRQQARAGLQQAEGRAAPGRQPASLACFRPLLQALLLGAGTLAASCRGGLLLLAFFFASSKITQVRRACSCSLDGLSCG